MTHLRRYLEDTGLLPPERLQQALRRQEIYGGSLDTVLLELELLDPATLGEVLVRACGLPLGGTDLLEDGHARPWRAIPGGLLDGGWVVPLETAARGVLVAVHPELPPEHLASLHQQVASMQPHVLPECCIEKVAAERHGGSTPQRYAVLFASYLAALRRRPSVTDVGFPLVPDLRPSPSLAASEPAEAPPVRFSARGTAMSPADRIRAHFDDAEARRKMAPARQRLAAAPDRDEAMTALLEAAGVIAPRHALLRVREHVLRVLPAPDSELSDLAGAEIFAPEGSTLARAVSKPRWLGETSDLTLQTALGLDRAIPCLMCRIDAAGRPVLVLYADQGGREFLPAEANALTDLCRDASATFERLLRAKVASRATVVGTVPVAADPPPTVDPPPAFGTTHPPGWGAAPEGLQEAYETVPHSASAELGPVEPGPSQRRDTQVDGSARSIAFAIRLAEAPAPEPPAAEAPSPPADPVDRDDDPAAETPPDLGSLEVVPRFIPPTFDEQENSGIIPLASPIHHQPSVRGQIAFDEEDWTPKHHRSSADETERRRIDAVLEQLAHGEGDVDDLRAFGEAGLTRLAEQFPGPLEVLRRDLRALPPPSAHGPYLRTAIQLAGDFVPHLLELMTHPEPDVRFYTAFVFQELRDPRCMPALARLGFDGSAEVRVISLRVLETYSRCPGFSAAVQTVRAELESDEAITQLHAARAVGTLRDVDSIERLIELLSSRDRFIQEASLESLCSITGQQHGLKPHRWKHWYAENRQRHRIEWIIDSLQHRDLPVRRWAHDELVRVTGHRVPFSPLGDREARDVAGRAWLDWWTAAGRYRLAAPET